MLIRMLWGLLPLCLLGPPLLQAQCPQVGDISGCGAVITVTDFGASVSFTAQGSYDALHGYYSLIGIINNSSNPISSLGLGSNQPIFAFDGHGIDNYNVSGNPDDPTGYGGPNAYFSSVDGTLSNGVVNFINPVPTAGGTDFFSLENSLISITACSGLLTGGLAAPSGGGTQIQASFTPNSGYSLAQTAQICGFTTFNWQQLITEAPAPSPFYAEGTYTNLVAPVPFNDPPPLGYTYQASNCGQIVCTPNAVILPVYYNLGTPASDPFSVLANESSTTLNFFDAPADTCLPGGTGQDCGGVAPNGSVLQFSTHMVGISGLFPNATVQDTGIGFTWFDTFNGTNGGISVLSARHGVDPGSGTGGITVTGINEISNFKGPNRLTVLKVNGNDTGAPAPLTLLTAAQVATTTSGLAYSRATQSFSGSVTVKNVTVGVLNGPFQVLLLSVPQGVSLMKATGTFGGSPFVTVAGPGALQPGQSVQVNVQFKNPGRIPVQFSAAIYVGGFDN